jgi:hypothetical protein
MALRTVHENRDSQEVIADRELAAGEDRSRRDAELVVASFAFPELARSVGVGARPAGADLRLCATGRSLKAHRCDIFAKPLS